MKKLLSVLVALMMLCAVPAMAEKLTMATNATFEPYEYIQNGEVIGLDVDFAKAICDQMG